MNAIVDHRTLDDYFRAGEARAASLGNRGPLRFTAAGALHPDIVEAYGRCGLYVLEGAVAPDEAAELKAEFMALLDRCATDPDSRLDARGRPALGSDLDHTVVYWSETLGDPSGGTAQLSGRAPVKMLELTPKAGAPRMTVGSITAPLQLSDAALRMYGHPALLAVAQAINGADFVPFQEGFIVKKPGEGRAFAWHQDGTTHWGPENDPDIHGFNMMLQLFPSTAANGLWYVPGSHRLGKVDIRAWIEAAGGNLLPDAVPLVCRPGDVAISNRQLVHGSFPNISDDWRVTFSMGFHRRSAVLGAAFRQDDGGTSTYDAERIRKRAELIGYAIAARRQRYPDEAPFAYRRHLDAGERFTWDDAARADIDGYSKLDLRI